MFVYTHLSKLFYVFCCFCYKYEIGMSSVCVQYKFSMRLVCVWYAFGTCPVRIRYTFGTRSVRVRYAFGTHSNEFRGAHTILKIGINPSSHAIRPKTQVRL